MTKRIIGIVLAVVGLVLGYSLLTSTEFETQAAALKNAVYLENAKILPENEGKVVILKGSLTLLEEARDPKFGLIFDSPYVRRYGEEYKDQGKDGKVDMRWVINNSLDGKFFGKVRLGDFILENAFLINLPSASYEGFDPEILREKKLRIDQDQSRSYITTAKRSFFENYMAGPIRYRYTYVPMDRVRELTVVGIQKGNSLAFSREGFRGEAYTKLMTKEEVLGKSASNAKFASIFGYVCCAALIAGGVFLVIRKG
ncbi:MAG: hypothetical protein SPI01_06855 [Succiniclasticum sp.]|nr:hypothetical protein [Succiniclasticum sp.]